MMRFTFYNRHTLIETNKNLFNKRNTLLSQEKTVVVHKQNNTLGFKVQYFFAPSQTNLASPYHKMATIFVKQLDANGPAAKAGLKQGDRILKVNGVSVFTKSLEDVVMMMKKREDYVVLTTVPWYKDFLQVEYPSYAYSEPESDASNTSLDRFSPVRTPPAAVHERKYNSLTRNYTGTRSNSASGNHSDFTKSSNHGHTRRSGTHSPRCTRMSEDVPVKPPRPSYVLRRHERDTQRPTTERDYGGSLDTAISPKSPATRTAPATRPANKRLSYSSDDKRKRFGTVQYFEDFQLPEKPSSSGASSKEMDPLCEALISQSKISPSELQRLTSDCIMEGYLDCKILDENSKRHTLRGWSKHFTTLHTSELCLYKNYNDYVEKRDKPEEGPVDISNCLVSIEYRLKKPVFRLTCQDGKEYLFKAESNDEMLEWTGVIQNLNDNQSLCNSLIKRKADELLKTDTLTKSNQGKIKEYKQEAEFTINSQYDFPSFGSTIEKCIKCSINNLVPAVVAGCIREVEERGLNTTGIYRLSGNEKAIHSLINEIDRDPRAVDYKTPPWTDIHNTCAALKQYFRRLAEPLIPANLYPSFMDAAQLPELETRQEKLRTLIKQLPECHLATAKLLFGHLVKVVANAEVNKMHTYNLAIIFGPTVIRSHCNDMVSLVADMSNQYKVVECLITKYSYIFEDEEEKELVEQENKTDEKSEKSDETSEKSQKSLPADMGLFSQKKYVPSQNGLVTPSDDRSSLPTDWKYETGTQRDKDIERADKSTQCSIPKPQSGAPKSPRQSIEDRIVYRKEPVGIVHPYKDDIKMRPVSRIFDKKLVTLDTSPREEIQGPKKSLSLESLLDVINAEQQQKRQLAKRGCSQQFESIHKFVNGLHKNVNGGRAQQNASLKPANCPKTRGIASTTSSTLPSSGPIKPIHSIPVKPVKPQQQHIYSVPYKRSSHSEERSRDRCNSDYARHDMVRTNNRKSTEISNRRSTDIGSRKSLDTNYGKSLDSRGRSEHRWAENMLHSHQGTHPSIPSSDRHSQARITRSHDAVNSARAASSDYYQRSDRQKARRGSDSRARWQPGHTHKWVLDNNTTLLESTL
ncbi:hypothetical protein ACHWQZ_G007099 [Mnemiopsis leidyi]